jgi:hypothetical protein
MSFTQRPKTLAEVAQHGIEGAEFGDEIKDFLHEFLAGGNYAMLQEPPCRLEDRVPDGRRFDAFLQALAVYLAVKVDCDPPGWTKPPIQLSEPWFAAPGSAVRNYLLLSSPAPFRTRNMFVDEDSLAAV